MSNAQATHTAHNSSNTTKHIWKVFWILLAITLFEVLWGMKISHQMPIWLNALFFLSLTLAKATYIVADFMHLRSEIKYLIRTIIVPLLLFIWFIIAFCWDGSSWRVLRKKYKQPAMEQKIASNTEEHNATKRRSSYR